MTQRHVLCLTVFGALSAFACTTSPPPPQEGTKTFVGSPACRDCHQGIYGRWQTTLMANVVKDPKKDPTAVIGDCATPNPLVTFTPADVAFTYGSKWKQRYWKKQGDDYFVLPAQWDIRHKMWRPYHVQKGTDWWVAHYPEAQEERLRLDALRWLPLGELRHQDACGHGVERGLRALPRGWRCPRCPPGEVGHRQPQSPRRCAGERCVHSVPLTGAAAGKTDRRPVLRPGPWAISPVTG